MESNEASESCSSMGVTVTATSSSSTVPQNHPSRKHITTTKQESQHGFINPSKTQYFKKAHREFVRVTKKEFYGDGSTSSSDVFGCVFGPDGKPYTQQRLLDRALSKKLDPSIEPSVECAVTTPAVGQTDTATKLSFLILDDVGRRQYNRIQMLLEDLYKYSTDGYIITVLPKIGIILDYLIENPKKHPAFEKSIDMLIEHIKKPILLDLASEVVKRFEDLKDYFGFLGYLLMRIEEDKRFDALANNLIWQLTAPSSKRGLKGVVLRHILVAVTPALHEIITRMMAVCRPSRYAAFCEIALILALDSQEGCLRLINDNIFENIFFRFNPYFPHNMLPEYETGPADPQDVDVKLGVGTINLTTTMNLLLVLSKTLEEYIRREPSLKETLPVPGQDALRCFIWAFRYECQARDHKYERLTMIVIANILLKCFGKKLEAFNCLLMPVELMSTRHSDFLHICWEEHFRDTMTNPHFPNQRPTYLPYQDVMSLAVMTEVTPQQRNWLSSVSMNTMSLDAQFKKQLIFFSVDLLQAFPHNVFMVETQHWLLGLIYLLDPDLCQLRVRWSIGLFDDLRNVALQALTCTLHLIPHRLIIKMELIRRILWYIEWYSVTPFELPVLYWSLRVLKGCLQSRKQIENRKKSLQDLFDTHGVNILIYLCYTLMAQKKPPLEKVQVILGLSLRMITSCVTINDSTICAVYPDITWPAAINRLAGSMLDTVWSALSSAYYLNGRWLVSLLNFIWEGIIWKDSYRAEFILKDGIFKLLDLVTMSTPALQCMALALVCDIARTGNGVAQLVTWRASIGAITLDPPVVSRGASIAALLAHIFRDECRAINAQVGLNGVILDTDEPLMPAEVRELLANEECIRDEAARTSVCYTAGSLAGSRLSKVFSLLHMLSDDLEHKVMVADVTYNMYKNVKLDETDEVTLVLCSHYLTLKQCEVWRELEHHCWTYLHIDDLLLKEFLEMSRGWVRLIQKQQLEVIEKRNREEQLDEKNLFDFLGRARLNIALDALVELRRAERATDREHLLQDQLNDSAHAHVRRTTFTNRLNVPIIKTYYPPLDQLNQLGQYVKVTSIAENYRSKNRGGGTPVPDTLSSSLKNEASEASEEVGRGAGDH